MLLGRDHEIIDAVPARNLSDDPSRFLVDPRDHIDARRDGRRRGLDVIGFYHSHPHSPATPSDTDRAEATYPDHLSVIVGLMTEPAEVRAFRFKDGSFHEASLRAHA